MASTILPAGDGPSNDAVIERLMSTRGRSSRIVFARNFVHALKRAGYRTQRHLFQAIKKHTHRLNSDVTKCTLPHWQHLYDGDDDSRLAAVPLCRRILQLVPVLLPEYTQLQYLVDQERFDSTTGVGSSYPPALRLSMSQAFDQWLEAGRHPKDHSMVNWLAGEYVICFPWLESAGRTGRIAAATARIRRIGSVWTFESRCYVNTAGPLIFAGQLCFTGLRSAVLVGFTSFPLPSARTTDMTFRAQHEMIVHPYRIPSEAGGWWHGSTAFLETDSLEYSATIGHVMRRASASVPTDSDWHGRATDPTPFLDLQSPEYREVRRELEQCPVFAG